MMWMVEAMWMMLMMLIMLVILDVNNGGCRNHGRDNAVVVWLGAVNECCWVLMLMLMMMYSIWL